MKKIIFITYLFLLFSNVKALSLDDITKELKETSTYQMYQNMESTKVTSKNNKITIDIKDINDYYFKAYIDDQLVSSDTLLVKSDDLNNKINYLFLEVIGVIIFGFIMIRKVKKSNDL